MSGFDRAQFGTTRWTLVVGTRSPGATGRRALEELCEAYWFPVYAYARRRGASEADAQDLTQGFFADLIARDSLDSADPERGTFRAFLLTCFRNYWSHERDKADAKKRGGDRTIVSLDFVAGEERYQLEPVDATTPDRLYERSWAWSLVDRVIHHMRAGYERAGREELFDSLKELLVREPESGELARRAEQLEMTHGALKVAVHRLRDRFRRSLREAVGETVSSPDQVEAELQALREALMS